MCAERDGEKSVEEEAGGGREREGVGEGREQKRLI